MKNITIIEDTHQLLDKSISINIDNALIQEPMTMLDIEEWEDVVTKMELPYVLAEVTMKAFSDDPDGQKAKKAAWQTGYMIFLKKEDLSEKFSFVDDLSQDAITDDGDEDYKVHL